jgi:hypothetical protein
MSHSDIYNPSYRLKKGRESNWQFDSRPLKSWESTRLRGLQEEGDMALESSQRELRDFFRLHLSRRFGQEVMDIQSPGIPTRDNFRTPPWESREKMPFGYAPVGSCREYYMGEGGGFPRVRAVVSQVSPRSPVASPNTKRVQNEF